MKCRQLFLLHLVLIWWRFLLCTLSSAATRIHTGSSHCCWCWENTQFLRLAVPLLGEKNHSITTYSCCSKLILALTGSGSSGHYKLVQVQMERFFATICYLKIGKTFGDVSCHYQGGCEENVNKYQYYIFMHVTGGQRSGRIAPFNWNIWAGNRTFSPFMMELVGKLLEVHHYITKRVNYINVHEATCPEANGFHRFHVLPVFICSRDNGNHTCVYQLPSLWDRYSLVQFSACSNGFSLTDLWASYYIYTI